MVGLHEPPRNTSTGADVSPFDNFRLQSSTLLKDFVLRNSVPVAVVAVLHSVPLLASTTRLLLSLFSCCRELNRFTLSQIDGEKVDVLLRLWKKYIQNKLFIVYEIIFFMLTHRKRFRSAASTQNSPKVRPFDWRLPLRANNLAVCSISLTGN